MRPSSARKGLSADQVRLTGLVILLAAASWAAPDVYAEPPPRQREAERKRDERKIGERRMALKQVQPASLNEEVETEQVSPMPEGERIPARPKTDVSKLQAELESTKAELDKAKAELDKAKAERDKAQAELKKATAALAEANDKLAKATTAAKVVVEQARANELKAQESAKLAATRADEAAAASRRQADEIAALKAANAELEKKLKETRDESAAVRKAAEEAAAEARARKDAQPKDPPAPAKDRATRDRRSQARNDGSVAVVELKSMLANLSAEVRELRDHVRAIEEQRESGTAGQSTERTARFLEAMAEMIRQR